jgi:hypothetical protein
MTPRPNMGFATLALVVCCSVVTGRAHAANTYTCTELDVPGATFTQLWRLNNNGYIAAGSSLGGYIYNPNAGTWTALPAPPAASGFTTADLVAFDINDQGTIVGAASDPNVNGGVEQGFILTSLNNGTYSFFTYVDPNNPANNNVEFRGVSNNGLITGWALSYVNGTAGGFVFNPTNSAIGSIAPGFNTFDPVLSDGSIANFTQVAGINASGLMVGSSGSPTIPVGSVVVGPNSLSFVQFPQANFDVRLRGINDSDPFNAGNCDANGSCVRTSGLAPNPLTGGYLAYYADYDPNTGYLQAPQTIDCSAQIPASAGELYAQGINNSDTIAASYNDSAGNPHGVVAYASTTAPASTCLASEGGCDLSNGLIPHNITGLSSLPGTVTESTCLVPQDPRIVQYGTCTGHSLPVAQVCPGFGTTVIPDTLCGGAGPSKSGFVLVNTIAEGVDALSGILVDSEAVASQLGGTPPACPATVAAWGPRSGSAVEGTVPEGTNIVELTGACGSSKGVSRGLSIYGVGLALNTAALPGPTLKGKLQAFTEEKYQNLFKTIAEGNMTFAERIQVNACVALSEGFFAFNKAACAARTLVRCDAQVAANVSNFSGSPGDPNVYGDIRGRLANLYLTINTRILGNEPNSTWPVSPSQAPACN